MMGSEIWGPDSKPVRQVTLTKGFYMSDHEVTQGEWKAVVGNEGYGTDKPTDQYGKGDNYPMYYVYWYDTLVYCNMRSIKEGLTPCYKIGNSTDPAEWMASTNDAPPTINNDTWNAVECDWDANGYRLPTEAEWEYAARGGDNTTGGYVWSGTKTRSEVGNYAWYKDNSSDKAHTVKEKSPNAFGLYDMSGNVYELCWDWYSDNYNDAGNTDPHGPSSGTERVRRGGSCLNIADNCAVYDRDYYLPYPDTRFVNNDMGFRVVRTIK